MPCPKTIGSAFPFFGCTCDTPGCQWLDYPIATPTKMLWAAVPRAGFARDCGTFSNGCLASYYRHWLGSDGHTYSVNEYNSECYRDSVDNASASFCPPSYQGSNYSGAISAGGIATLFDALYATLPSFSAVAEPIGDIPRRFGRRYNRYGVAEDWELQNSGGQNGNGSFPAALFPSPIGLPIGSCFHAATFYNTGNGQFSEQRSFDPIGIFKAKSLTVNIRNYQVFGCLRRYRINFANNFTATQVDCQTVVIEPGDSLVIEAPDPGTAYSIPLLENSPIEPHYRIEYIFFDNGCTDCDDPPP